MTHPADDNESPIILTSRESLRLLELIENPPPRNEKFVQAMNRYQASIDEPRLPAQDDGPLTNEDISALMGYPDFLVGGVLTFQPLKPSGVWLHYSQVKVRHQ